MADLTEVRSRAWKTRREKYGQRGHKGSYNTGYSVLSMLEKERLEYLEMIHRVFVRVLREGVDCDNPTLSEGQATKLLMEREDRARAAGFAAAKEAAVKVALDASEQWSAGSVYHTYAIDLVRAIRAIEDRP